MTQLEWDAVGARVYEFGVDRGVLYPLSGSGVPWNGLVAVRESSNGGDFQSFYIDGANYLSRADSEEFEATIEAFTYPNEFVKCEGTVLVKAGLFVTKQKRQSFGLAYRTKVGNDTEGQKLGYKLHLIYGAKVSPSDRDNASISDSIDPLNFSWRIITTPPALSDFKPAAHFIIDSQEAPDSVLEMIEDILYGTVSTSARLPSVDELIFLFEIYDTNVYDAGYITEVYYLTLDGGVIPSAQTTIVDGGEL